MAWIDWYKQIQEQLADLLAGESEAGTAVPDIKVTLDSETVTLAATESHLGAVGGHTEVIDLTLSLDTGAYADGDVQAATQELASALRAAGGSGDVRACPRRVGSRMPWSYTPIRRPSRGTDEPMRGIGSNAGPTSAQAGATHTATFWWPPAGRMSCWTRS